jgi:plastocyanin
MRFTGLALVASAIVLGACGGDNKSNTNTDSVAAAGASAGSTSGAAGTPGAAATPAAGDAAGGAGGAAAGGTAKAAAVTGKTVDVKMIGDDKGYRFEPANVTVKAGDGIRFTMVSGGPHNVAFDPAQVPADVKSQLSANMPNQMAELSSPLLVNPNETYTISFANVKAGTYDYHCTPHLAMNMKGQITVQ